MYGAVFGDIIGSIYELHNVKTVDFPLFPVGSTFTDDTVMTVAVAEKLLTQPQNKHFFPLLPQITSAKSYALWFKQYYRRYPNVGYGQMFAKGALSESFIVQRSTYVFNSRTSYSVQPAIQAFMESSSYEDAVRKAVSIGGDSDTIACITGGIAHAYYKKIPDTIYSRAITYLDSGLKDTLRRFEEQFQIPR